MARTRSSLAHVAPRRSAAPSRARMAPRHGRAFGRAHAYDAAPVQRQQARNAELRQFMTTFLGGLVFVSVLIA